MLLPLCALKRADHRPLDGKVGQLPLVVHALIAVDRVVVVDQVLPILRRLVDLLLESPLVKALVRGCKRRHWPGEQVHVVVAHLVAKRKSNTAAVVFFIH